MKFAETILAKAPKLEMISLPSNMSSLDVISKSLAQCGALKYLEDNVWLILAASSALLVDRLVK